MSRFPCEKSFSSVFRYIVPLKPGQNFANSVKKGSQQSSKASVVLTRTGYSSIDWGFHRLSTHLPRVTTCTTGRTYPGTAQPKCIPAPQRVERYCPARIRTSTNWSRASRAAVTPPGTESCGTENSVLGPARTNRQEVYHRAAGEAQPSELDNP